MDSSSKRIIKNTGLLYLRQLLTLGLSLYTARLTLQVLGESDFGIYATVAGFTALLSTFTNSFASGTQRFITFELVRGDYKKLNRIYCSAINIHLFLSAILILVGETLGTWFIFNKMTVPPERLMTTFWVFQITILNSVLALINTPNNAEIVAHEDMGVWALFSIIDAILKCIAVVVLFLISWDKLLFYALFLFVIQFVNRIICIIWCKRNYIEARFTFIWDSPLLRSMLSITGWTGLINLAVTGFIQGVNLLLNIFFGPALNAAYTIAMQAYSGIRQFCSNFQLASNPQIVKLYSIGEIEKMQSLLFSVCKLSFFLIFALSLPFILNVNFILNLWLKEVPAHTQTFFVLLIIFAYVDVFAFPLDIAAQATGRLKRYSLLVSFTFISILLFAYIAYSLGAIPETIYYISIVVSWICLFIRIFCLSKLIKLSVIKFLKCVVLRSVFVAITASTIPLLMKFFLADDAKMGMVNFFISFLCAICAIFVVGLDKTEKDLVISIINKRTRKNE